MEVEQSIEQFDYELNSYSKPTLSGQIKRFFICGFEYNIFGDNMCMKSNYNVWVALFCNERFRGSALTARKPQGHTWDQIIKCLALCSIRTCAFCQLV